MLFTEIPVGIQDSTDQRNLGSQQRGIISLRMGPPEGEENRTEMKVSQRAVIIA